MSSSNLKFFNSLIMAVAPGGDNLEGLDFQKLTSYLSDKIGIPVKLIYCKDYNEAMTMLSDGAAQLGWLGSYAYQKLESDNSPVVEFAVGVPKGKNVPFYRSQFIVRSDSNIQILEDVRNKTIALGDVYSTSGYEVPRRELLEVGINLQNEGSFKAIINVANHDEAIRSVIEGTADVAPVSSINLDTLSSSCCK